MHLVLPRCNLAVIATLALMLHSPAGGEDLRDRKSAVHFRRPVALGVLPESKRLCVANRDSGTVSLVDLDSNQVLGEYAVGKRLSDLAIHPDGRHIFVTDEAAHEVIALKYDSARLAVVARKQVSSFPVEVTITPDGSRCFVTALWSRKLDIIDIVNPADADSVAFGDMQSVPLGFEPRKLLLLPEQDQLLVADSHGGQMAVIDVAQRKAASRFLLPGHNIRGLALSRDGERVFVAHQILNPLARTSFDDIHWGHLINNVVRSLHVDRLSGTDPLHDNELLQLGDTGNGAADPADLVVLEYGQVAVALAGTGELTVVDTAYHKQRRFPVGDRPVAVVNVPDTNELIVCNQFSDSLVRFSTSPDSKQRRISLGSSPEESPQRRGERLFFDASLSHDRWLSCHSCHSDGHTNGLLADTLGDGSYGAAKRVPTLLGVSRTDTWAWNGAIKELTDQIHKSVLTSMHGGQISGEQVNDLAAYLQSLEPPPPLRAEFVDAADQASHTRGKQLFGQLGCVKCHVPPITYTTGGAFDVGLADEVGNKRFNPPSLRGVGRRSGYFHDKRATTLDAVFDKHQHQLNRGLGEQELRDLVRFLQSL